MPPSPPHLEQQIKKLLQVTNREAFVLMSAFIIFKHWALVMVALETEKLNSVILWEKEKSNNNHKGCWCGTGGPQDCSAAAGAPTSPRMCTPTEPSPGSGACPSAPQQPLLCSKAAGGSPCPSWRMATPTGHPVVPQPLPNAVPRKNTESPSAQLQALLLRAASPCQALCYGAGSGWGTWRTMWAEPSSRRCHLQRGDGRKCPPQATFCHPSAGTPSQQGLPFPGHLCLAAGSTFREDHPLGCHWASTGGLPGRAHTRQPTSSHIGAATKAEEG